MIAIQSDIDGWHKTWIDYCLRHNLAYKVVDCYGSDIIEQLQECDTILWHHYHLSTKDTLFAKQLLYSLEMAGKKVYPDFRSAWHFDDKVGQKYLLESIGAPLVPSYVFYDKNNALKWAEEVNFPKVFKLRGGSSSENVKLVKHKQKARHLIKKAFGRGFSQYNSWENLRERFRRYRAVTGSLRNVFEGIIRLVVSTPYSRARSRDIGYIYFQDFIPGNEHDIRVTYVFNKCFATRRIVRPGDFRASGSGLADWDMSKVPLKAIKIAFDVSEKLKLQSAAFDFVMSGDEPMIVEMSYAFGYHKDMFKFGYWNRDLIHYPGVFNPFEWMIEGMINSTQK